MLHVPPSAYILTSDEVPVEVRGIFRKHKDGRFERLAGTNVIAAGIDTLTGIQSKDVVISQKTNQAVRIYIPKDVVPDHKLPILIYYHGGSFMTESFASSTYHPTLNLITMESNVISVSIDYRLAPEYPIPIPYEDSWEATKWVANHNGGNGTEAWLNDYADFKNVFFAGDSAGANIAHNMAIRVGVNTTKPVNNDINLQGVIMLHPSFGGKDPIGEESGKDQDFKVLADFMWNLASPLHIGLDDPLINPAMDPLISNFGCSKILLYVGEKDKFKVRGLNYKNVMENSGWKGRIELMESKGGHVFFLFNPSSENAHALRERICTFINPIRSKA